MTRRKAGEMVLPGSEPKRRDSKNNNNLTLRDRVSRLEGRTSVILALDVGTFLAVMALILSRAFA